MSVSSSTAIRSLTVGMGWYPVNQGNGLDRVFFELFRHAPAAGLDMDAIVVSAPQIEAPRVHVVDEAMSAPARIAAVGKTARSLAASADVLSAHFALYALPLVRLARRQPLVVHFHGPWAAESRAEGQSAVQYQLKRLVEQRVYSSATRFIVLSEAFRDMLVKDFRANADDIDVVPGGVDLARFQVAASKDELRTRLGWPADRPIMVCVRRLVRRVGIENLIDAMVEINRTCPDLLLKIGGRGPLEDELKRRVHERGLDNSVEFLGFVPEETLPAVYAAADASVIPTVGLEGFGLIAAESLAAGTPPFVTPVGGLPEVVRDLDATLILESSSHTAIADRIIHWQRGDAAVPSRDVCRAYAEQKFDWARVAARTRQVYEVARQAS